MVFATIFQFFYLRLAIFFGCLGIFSNLFRGEVLEKTLHYYFLAPVRREVLLVGKYLAGLIAGGDAVRLRAPRWRSSVSSCISGRPSRTSSGAGPGWGNWRWYLVVTALACVGYGAVFLTVGLMFRNPMIPAAVVMVWEAINGFLPELLQKIQRDLLPEIAVPGGGAASRAAGAHRGGAGTGAGVAGDSGAAAGFAAGADLRRCEGAEDGGQL